MSSRGAASSASRRTSRGDRQRQRDGSDAPGGGDTELVTTTAVVAIDGAGGASAVAGAGGSAMPSTAAPRRRGGGGKDQVNPLLGPGKRSTSTPARAGGGGARQLSVADAEEYGGDAGGGEDVDESPDADSARVLAAIEADDGGILTTREEGGLYDFGVMIRVLLVGTVFPLSWPCIIVYDRFVAPSALRRRVELRAIMILQGIAITETLALYVVFFAAGGFADMPALLAAEVFYPIGYAAVFVMLLSLVAGMRTLKEVFRGVAQIRRAREDLRGEIAKYEHEAADAGGDGMVKRHVCAARKTTQRVLELELAYTTRMVEMSEIRPSTTNCWVLRNRMAQLKMRLPVFVAHPRGWRARTVFVALDVTSYMGGDAWRREGTVTMDSTYDGDPNSYRRSLRSVPWSIPAARSHMKAHGTPGEAAGDGVAYVTLEQLGDQVVYAHGLEPTGKGVRYLLRTRRLVYSAALTFSVGTLAATPLWYRYILDRDRFDRTSTHEWGFLVFVAIVEFIIYGIVLKMCENAGLSYGLLRERLANLNRMLTKRTAAQHQLPYLGDFRRMENVVAFSYVRDYVKLHTDPVVKVSQVIVGGLATLMVLDTLAVAAVYYNHALVVGVDNLRYLFTMTCVLFVETLAVLTIVVFQGSLANVELSKMRRALEDRELYLRNAAALNEAKRPPNPDGSRYVDADDTTPGSGGYGRQLRLLRSLHRHVSSTSEVVKFFGLTLTPTLVLSVGAPLASILPVVIPALEALLFDKIPFAPAGNATTA